MVMPIICSMINSVLQLAIILLALTLSGLAVHRHEQNMPGSLSVEDGRRFADKLTLIMEHDDSGSNNQQTVLLPENEVNAYLQFQVVPLLPPSVTQPRVAMMDDGRVLASATIDLDAVDTGQDRGLMDPLRYLSGRVQVTVSGVLQTADGVGVIKIESATLSGVTVPAAVLDELVRVYSRNRVNPQGFKLAEPFELPYHIREVLISIGKAVVMQ